MVSRKSTPRRRRRSRAELEELLLAAGRDILVRDGLTLGVEEVTFKRAFDHLEQTEGVKVTYASVMGRIWENQADFQVALIRSVLEQGRVDRPELLRLIGHIQDAVDAADLSSEAGRWEAAEEVCRVGAEDYLDLLGADPWWPLWMSIWSHLTTHNDGTHDGLLKGLRENYHGGDGAFAFVHELLGDRLGLRIKPEFTIESIVVMLFSAAEGSAIRYQLEPGALMLASRNDRCWTTLAITFVGILRTTFEADPDWQAR